MKKILSIILLLVISIQASFCQSNFDYKKAKKPQLIIELTKQGFKESDINIAKRKDLLALYPVVLKVNEIDKKIKSFLEPNYVSYLDSSRYIYNFNELQKLEAGIKTFNSVKQFKQSCINDLSNLIKREYTSTASFNTGDELTEKLFMSAKTSIESYNQSIITYSNKLTNDIQDLLSFLKEKSTSHEIKLEQVRKHYAEKKREVEEIKKREQEEMEAERENRRIANEEARERKAKRELELANLPTKASINTKFRTYKHKTGHTFEMFPTNFTPKQNKATYDKIKIMGKVYTARYREHNDYVNSLVIEFFDSGKISEVTVFNGSETIYSAKYKDGSNKPYEIRTKSADSKFELIIKRLYNFMTDKIEESITYYYKPLDHYFD